MARRPIPSIRWRGPSKPAPSASDIAELVDASFAAFRSDAAAEFAETAPLFRKAVSVAQSGITSAVQRALRYKHKRKTKIKTAIKAKFCALKRRIDQYYLARDDAAKSQIFLRLELLESDLTEKLISLGD
jgi:hypothetical protein